MTQVFTSLASFNFVTLREKLAPILHEKPYIVDVTFALTNLISIIEHLAFTGAKTHKSSYYDLTANVQSMVQKLFVLLKVSSDLENVSRDFLATSMRLMEVGTKQWSLNEQTLAQDFFQHAYELQLLFYSINSCLVIDTATFESFNAAVFAELHSQLDQFSLAKTTTNEEKNTKKTAASTSTKVHGIAFKDLSEFVEKVDSLKKQNRLDLSSDQDLVLSIMNLINLEEELYLLGVQTKNQDYYNLLFKVREMRKTFLKTIVQHYEGEVWCISKHLLASSMRCMQAGTKLANAKQDKLAYELFQFSYDLYSLFWGLNLGVLQHETEHKKGSFLDKLGVLVKKAIDCCIE